MTDALSNSQDEQKDITPFQNEANTVNHVKNTSYKVNFGENICDMIHQQIHIRDDNDSLIHESKYLASILFDFENPYHKDIVDTKDDSVVNESNQPILSKIQDIFEQERVESCYSLPYPGIGAEFELQRQQRGLENNDTELDPLTALELARNGRDDRLKGTEFEFVSDYLKQVHFSGSSKVSTKLAYDYFVNHVKEWFNEQNYEELKQQYTEQGERKTEHINEQHEQNKTTQKESWDMNNIDDLYDEREEEFNKQMEELEKQRDTMTDEQFEEQRQKLEESYENDIRDIMEKIRESAHNSIESTNDMTAASRIQQEVKNKIDDVEKQKTRGNFTETAQSLQEKFREDDKDILNGTKYDQEELEKVINTDIDKLIKSGKEELDLIKNKIDQYISKQNKLKILPKYTVKPSRNKDTGTYKIDHHIVSKLSILFDQIIARQKASLDKTGHMIDVDAYIQDVCGSQQGMYYTCEERTRGLDIVIGIDCSGSMGYSDLEACRVMCGTLLTSVEKLPSINMQFVSWCGNSGDEDEIGSLHVRIHKTRKDIEYITNDGGGTPTGEAHQYIDDMLKQSKSTQKVVIMMTDGCPNNEETTELAVKQSRQKGNNVYGVLLGTYSDADTVMKQIYGKQNFTVCENMEQTSNTITKLVKNLIVKSIR